MRDICANKRSQFHGYVQIYFGKLTWKGPRMTPIDLIHKLNLNDIPDAVKEQAKLSILDLI